MNNHTLKRIAIPIIVLILCTLLYLFGYFEIIIATIIIIIASAIEYKKELFASLGFQRKKRNFINLFVIAPLVAGGLFILYAFIVVPGVTSITGQPINFSAFDEYQGNVSASLILLAFIWSSAAFGEEIVFRGYFMRQFTKFFGSSTLVLILNILLFGFIFGYIHSYQGLTGQIVTGIIGILLSFIFHLKKSDLWFNIAIHGFFDTIAVVYIYNGWY